MNADFPLFDGHMHFSAAYLDEELASFDECGVQGGVNLWWPEYHDYPAFLKICAERGLLEKFAQLYWPDWRLFGWQGDVFVQQLIDDMRCYAEMGCTGLKVWKDIGMMNFFPDGTPVTMDDERLEKVWQTAAELDWVIYVHQADPPRSFEKLSRTPLSREDLFSIRDKVLTAHPEIRFVLCHSGNDIGTLEGFADLLERFPHINADLRSSMLKDTSPDNIAFLEKYADRLYAGPDMIMPPDRPPDRPWNRDEVYGPLREGILSLGLSESAFKAITWENGRRDFF